ncbi:MAG: hypothetical protein KA003_06185 [Caldilineaceae bacterium]|nr:hypothetical protein [Caldilineaceae bacterium]MBP8109686.1 hypothetical protein [Caldilineaceae bacterium]MBP8124484.1 hypothetical protein [Caldilineaceae bacterium]
MTPKERGKWNLGSIFGIVGQGREDSLRRFKDAIHRHGVADDWYAYRQRAFEGIAVGWLAENGVAFVRG